MDKQTEQIQVFFEISMAIGRSLDLKIMLRQALTVFLKKLNRSAAGVLLYKQNKDEYALKDSFVIPRNFLEKQNLLKDHLRMKEKLTKKDMDNVLAFLPLNREAWGNNYLVMELHGLGLFFLVRNSSTFNEYLVKSLDNLISRLAQACTACYQNEELISTKADLELRVKKRTKQLEERNIELISAYSDLKNAQKQLVQNEKMVSIGHLAAGVAHEINNPTGFITTNLYTMTEYINVYKKLFEQMDRLSTEVTLKHYETVPGIINNILAIKEEEDYSFILGDSFQLLEESIDGARRIKVIVQGLRDYARPKDAQYKVANFNHAIENALKLTMNELKYKCEVEKQLGEIPEISCRLDQLTQVFVNLLINAGHSIENFGKITVKTCLDDDNIKAEICDDGTGISEKNVGKLFDPFFSTKPVGEGTGLGLFISHGIIEDHGGTISVKSSLGEGTCFIIMLPLNRETI